MSEQWLTKQTLIQRVKEASPDDKNVWNEFNSFYESFIVMLLRKWNCAKEEREDLKQEILVRIWKGIPNYEYRQGEAKFRTWLSTLIKNTMLSYLDKRNRRHPDKLELNEVLYLPADQSSLEEIIEEEWSAHIMSMAMENVKEHFSGQAFEVFQLSLKGKTIAEIAEQLGIVETSAYTLRSRFKARLKKEFQALKEMLENEK